MMHFAMLADYDYGDISYTPFQRFLYVLVYAGCIAIGVLGAIFPGYNARARKHPQAIAINILGWFSLVAVLANGLISTFIYLAIFIPATVWSYTAGSTPETAPGVFGIGKRGEKTGAVNASLVPNNSPSRPLKFRIVGVDRDSKMDTTWFCEADSEANARVKAELEGIIVTAIAAV